MTSHVLGLADLERENALLGSIIEAVSEGPEVEQLAGGVARLITAATDTDVCFVHVLDDIGRSLILAGATPPFDEQVGQVVLPMGGGVTGWVASHHQPAVIPEHKEADPATGGSPRCAARSSPRWRRCRSRATWPGSSAC